MAIKLAKYGTKRRETLNGPRKDLFFVAIRGYGKPSNACFVPVATSIFPGIIMWPRLSTESVKKAHFFILRMKSASFNNRRTTETGSTCSSNEDEKTITSTK